MTNHDQATRLRADARILDDGMHPDLVRELHAEADKLDPPPVTLEALTVEYQARLFDEGLPQLSADELLHYELTDDQRRYVSDFLMRWNAVEEGPDFLKLAREAYAYAEENYGMRDARYDVIVECMTTAEIAAELEGDGVHNLRTAHEWADRRARAQHEKELNQAWDGPESCIGSSKYDPAHDPSEPTLPSYLQERY